MSLAKLLEPVLENGVRSTNYFNGRLLTAEDLRTDQVAAREKRRQLGVSIGDGVVWGMDVSVDPSAPASQPVVLVSEGLAINRNGETVALRSGISVALTRNDSVAADDAGLFAECVPVERTLTNPGLYILTIAPASGLSGRAPMIELGADGVASKCASAFGVEGVRLNLVRIDLPPPASGLAADILTAVTELDTEIAGGATLATLRADPQFHLFRNMAAHLCFGTETLRKMPALLNPDADFSLPFQYYRDGKLANCETPLALLYWNRAGVAFVDTWAVRRPATLVTENRPWGPHASARRMAAGLAVFYDFADQMDSLLASPLTDFQLSTLAAKNCFRFLPSACLIPIARIGFRGMTRTTFFQQMTVRGPVFFDGARLADLLFESFRLEPVDLLEKEFVWLYQAWQNSFQIDQGQPVAGYMVCASPHLPFQATSRFDLARWDYSNCNGAPLM